MYNIYIYIEREREKEREREREREAPAVDEGARKGTDGVGANGVTANFVLLTGTCLGTPVKPTCICRRVPMSRIVVDVVMRYLSCWTGETPTTRTNNEIQHTSNPEESQHINKQMNNITHNKYINTQTRRNTFYTNKQ